MLEERTSGCDVQHVIVRCEHSVERVLSRRQHSVHTVRVAGNSAVVVNSFDDQLYVAGSRTKAHHEGSSHCE